MFETLGFQDVTPLQASVVLGLVLGAVYGVLAQRSGFCLRRSLVGDRNQCLPALGVWAMALALAIAGTQGAVAAGVVSFDAHRFLAPDLPVVAVLVGGALFGAGMVLSGGCVSRLAVLSGAGNLRAVLVLVVFAIVAHAAMKGVLAPLRSALAGITVDPGGVVALTALPGGAVWAWSLALAAAVLALRSGASRRHLVMAALIGLLVPLGWVGTGFVLQDDFDPLPLQSLGFTGPTAGHPVLDHGGHRHSRGVRNRSCSRRGGRKRCRRGFRGRVSLGQPGRAAADRPVPYGRRVDGNGRCPGGRVYGGGRIVRCVDREHCRDPGGHGHGGVGKDRGKASCPGADADSGLGVLSA